MGQNWSARCSVMPLLDQLLGQPGCPPGPVSEANTVGGALPWRLRVTGPHFGLGFRCATGGLVLDSVYATQVPGWSWPITQGGGAGVSAAAGVAPATAIAASTARLAVHAATRLPIGRPGMPTSSRSRWVRRDARRPSPIRALWPPLPDQALDEIRREVGQ
jgi:hypothetical protein